MLKDALDALIKAVADLEKAARSDDKTPLQNSLALNEAKETFGISENNPNILVFADINDFKFVNGEYGYANGDAAINQVGIKIQELLVENCQAQAFRQSGDEFIILLHKDSLNDFRKSVQFFESCFVSGIECEFSVSVSFGYFVKIDECDFETLRARAETACKKAKKQDKEICVEWTEEIEENLVGDFRKNCPKCKSVTSCYIPQNSGINKIRFCAACGYRFESVN